MSERPGFLLILSSILLQALSGVFSKYAAMMAGGISVAVILNAFFLLSLVCLAAQAIVWQQALKRFPLSYAYPFLSLVNFAVLLMAYAFFGEPITATNVAGIAVITAGVSVLSQGDARA